MTFQIRGAAIAAAAAAAALALAVDASAAKFLVTYSGAVNGGADDYTAKFLFDSGIGSKITFDGAYAGDDTQPFGTSRTFNLSGGEYERVKTPLLNASLQIGDTTYSLPTNYFADQTIFHNDLADGYFPSLIRTTTYTSPVTFDADGIPTGSLVNFQVLGGVPNSLTGAVTLVGSGQGPDGSVGHYSLTDTNGALVSGVFDGGAKVTVTAAPKVVFLDFDAEPGLHFSSTTQAPAIYDKPSFDGDVARALVTTQVQGIFSKYLVDVTDERPTGMDGQFMTVHVGGRSTLANLESSTNGIVRTIGTAASVYDDDAYVFPDNLAFLVDPFDRTLSQVVAHEIGHMLGLAHVYDSDQLMWPVSGGGREIGGLAPYADLPKGAFFPVSLPGAQNSDALLSCFVGVRSTGSYDCSGPGLELPRYSLSTSSALYDARFVFHPGGGADGAEYFLGSLGAGQATDLELPFGPDTTFKLLAALTEGGALVEIPTLRTVNGDGSISFAFASGAVPEPIAWTLMIAGIAATGTALRWRRNKGMQPVPWPA